MTDQDKLNFKEKYQNNPVAFVKDFYNLKLYPYQKIVLNTLHTKDKIVSFINGCMNQKLLLSNVQLEYMKAREMNFEVWCKDGIEVYKKGILVRTIKHKK